MRSDRVAVSILMQINVQYPDAEEQVVTHAEEHVVTRFAEARARRGLLWAGR
jgi:hypothetical protein